jgi:hypothetical protein
MKVKTVIELGSDSAKVITTNDDGTVTNKVISMSSLCTVLSSVAKDFEMVIPPGCRKIYESKNYAMYVFIAPSFIGNALTRWEGRDCSRHGDLESYKPDPEIIQALGGSYSRDSLRVFKVPFPATGVGVVVRKEKDGTFTYVKMYCYALKTHLGEYNTYEAYAWPFTNVFSSGECCIGNIITKYPTVESLAGVPKYIFNGVCNHDLTGPSNIVGNPSGNSAFGKVDDSFDLMVKCRDRQYFPWEYLKPIGNLNSVLASIMTNFNS